MVILHNWRAVYVVYGYQCINQRFGPRSKVHVNLVKNLESWNFLKRYLGAHL